MESLQINLIHKLFEKQTERTPESIAVICNDNKITYKDLNEKADILAGLISKKEEKGSIVAIEVKRSINMIVGILAILKAGLAYLPIDNDYPEERINYMLEDSDVKLLITQNSITGRTKSNIKLINLDEEDIFTGAKLNFDNTIHTNDLAYVIYTSGSTGKPKGVMIEHRSVVNFFNGVTELIDFSEEKKILALTTISFDIFVLETLLPLTKGLSVVLVDESTQKNPQLLSDAIIRNEIDMLQMTPSRMQLLINHDKELKCLKSLKEIMVGGEALPQVLLERIKSHTNAKIYNMYGPTETTVWSTISNLTEKDKIDIGKPIVNTQLYIIDENNKLVPNGVEGELCIGGVGLARGYLNKPELTAEKFIPNPFISGEKIYKTGDLAKWLSDGNVEYVGRIDNQVKIRGHRIEIEEIEYALLKFKLIKQAVVTARQGKENINYLCAYYVSDQELLLTDIKEYLSGILPDYMIPAYFIRLDSIPQTPNGKVSRKELPDPEALLTYKTQQKIDQQEENADNVDVGFKITKIIRDNIDIPLSLDSIELNCNLADLGINSLTFIRIVVIIETEFNFEFSNEDLDANKFGTVASLVTYVENRITR